MSPSFTLYKEKIAHLSPFLFLFLAVVIYYWPQVTLQAVPFSGDPAGSDLLQVHLPYLAYSAERLKEFSAPLWTSRIGSGYPLFANGASSFFYPLTQALFLILPPIKAFAALFPLHALIAALAMYWYCRTIGIKEWGATLAGITFAFSGYFVGHLKHVVYFMSASLTPLAFVCVSRYRATRSPRQALALGAVLALMLFAGSSQVVYQTILFLAFTSILYIIGAYFQKLIASHSWKERLVQGLHLIGNWVRFAAVAAIALAALSAVQILPTWELVHYSTRELVSSFSFATNFPFHPKSLLTFLEPFAFGNPAYLSYTDSWNELINKVGLFWENIGYVGLIPLFLAAASLPFIIWKRAWRQLIWLGALLFAIFLAMGKYYPVYAWCFKWIPGFSSFRIPGRYLLWVDFSIAVLAGFAFQQLLDALLHIKKIIFSKRIVSFIGIALLCAAFFDLMVFGYHYNAMDRLEIKVWEKTPQSAEFLSQQNGFRFTTFFTGQYYQQLINIQGGWQNDLLWLQNVRELLPPDHSLFYRVESLPDYSPLPLDRSNKFFDIAHNNVFDTITIKQTPAISKYAYHMRDHNLSLLGLANVKYILSPVLLDSPLINETAHIILNEASESIYIYELTRVQQRAYLTARAIAVSSKDEATSALSQNDFDANIALAEYSSLPSLNASNYQAAITHTQEGLYKILTETDGNALLVLNESWYPGWRATIDGAETAIFPVNLAFQGIIVPEGEHRIEFQYRSQYFFWGAIVSGIAWFTLLIFTIQYWYRRHHCPHIHKSQ
ncbi:MAG: YfhO family protein [Patescibacteria group bacterium]